jgi:hypothetical protein
MAITPPIRQMTPVANRTTVAGAGQRKPGDAAGPASLVRECIGCDLGLWHAGRDRSLVHHPASGQRDHILIRHGPLTAAMPRIDWAEGSPGAEPPWEGARPRGWGRSARRASYASRSQRSLVGGHHAPGRCSRVPGRQQGSHPHLC